MKLKEQIKYVLNNEAGGPNVETLIGVSISMAVGTGIYIVGKEMVLWLYGTDATTASSTSMAKQVDGIALKKPESFW